MSYKCIIRCDECDGTGWLDAAMRESCDCAGGSLDWEFDSEESIRSQINNIEEGDLVPLLIWVVAEYASAGLSVAEIEKLDGVKALRARLETPKRKVRRAA